MGNPNIGISEWPEYREGRLSRIEEPDLCIDGLYLMMFSIQGSEGYFAAQYPTWIQSKEKVKVNRKLYKIEHTVLTPRRQDFKITSYFKNGFRLGSKSGRHASGRITVKGDPVVSGYFSQEFQPFEHHQDLQEWLEQPPSEASLEVEELNKLMWDS